MSDVNRILTSLLLFHTIRRYFWRIVVIEVSYILLSYAVRVTRFYRNFQK